MLQIRCLQELKRLQPVGRGFQVVIAEKSVCQKGSSSA